MNFALKDTQTGELTVKRWHTRAAVAKALNTVYPETARGHMVIVEVPDVVVPTQLKTWCITVNRGGAESKSVLVVAPTIKAAYRELRSYLVQATKVEPARIQRALMASYEAEDFEEVDLSGPGVCAIV